MTRRNLETSKLVLALIGKVSAFQRVKEVTVAGRYQSKVLMSCVVLGKATDFCTTYYIL